MYWTKHCPNFSRTINALALREQLTGLASIPQGSTGINYYAPVAGALRIHGLSLWGQQWFMDREQFLPGLIIVALLEAAIFLLLLTTPADQVTVVA